MENWINEELSKVLGFQVPEDLVKYITEIKRESDFNEYMKTLLDFSNQQHKSFFIELSRKKFPSKGASPVKQKKKIAKSKPQQEFVTVETPDEASRPAVQEETKDGKKKKTKFVNLYSKEGKNAQVILLKGRHACDCEASVHELINNCLECGRVVCTQEGSGPCLFCGALVCTEEEEKQINSNSTSGVQLKDSLMEREKPQGWEEALAHRNRLLEFDQNGEKRTQVFDDDSDYFNTNSVWIGADEKEKLDKYKKELHEKKHASRLSKKMTFDFAGRQIVEENTIEHAIDMDKIQQITGASKPRAQLQFKNDMLVEGSGGRDLAPGVDPVLVQFNETVEKKEYAAVTRLPAAGKVQDAMLQEMSDMGKCLSMHQPWASLLVEGIKMHEGRTWYTSHRGRLWIASTAKPPEPDIIKAIENQYRVLYPEKNFKFPSFYPTGCLLGCVNVDDCLPQEEYIKQYPDGESDSPYVFICSNPMSLKLRFPIQGQHKIYALDKTIHKAAVKCLQTMSKYLSEEANAG
ncbi:activating signal cointegrator 1 [Hyposmocoma kahamanoa]|uniref:activating signal cointegrator 1 n=1 Tax=Hyposmocoma kahamanoa TaxID=1477025 RepID=UPI000E6D98D2|nr:activating signal cointegrator 1 [Hyposmocoma kahamanoa]